MLVFERMVREGLGTTQFSNRWCTADGRWRRLEWTATVLSDGTLYGTAQDCTQEREPQRTTKRHRPPSELALAQLGIGHWAADARGRLLELAPLTAELLGTPDARPQLASRLFQPLDLPCRLRVRRALDRCRRDGTPVDLRCQLTRAAHELHLRAQAQRDEHGRIVAIVGTVQRITAAAPDPSPLRAELASAQQARHALSHRIDTTAHELRNHLSAIHSAATAISATPASLPAAIQTAATDLLRLVDELTGQSPGATQLSAVDPAHLLDDVLALLAPSARHVRLLRTAHPLTPQLVRLDPRRLRQALTNLTLNAIKYTTDGEIHLHVAHERDGEQQWLRFEVRDTGPGIAPALRDTVLHPYVGSSGAAGGAGLGLSIVNDLVTAMRGTLHLDSSERGTVVTLRVPCAEPEAAPTPARQRSAHQVLLVDDHPIGARVAAGMLQGLGCQVTVAGSIGEAQRLAEHRAWDLILVDHYLPDGTGAQLAAFLRELDRRTGRARTPIIGTSAESDAAALWHGADLDGDAPKPVSPQQLANLLRAHLKR